MEGLNKMEILTNLLNMRSKALKAGKAAKDSDIKALYFGKVLAYNEIINKLEGKI